MAQVYNTEVLEKAKPVPAALESINEILRNGSGSIAEAADAIGSPAFSKVVEEFNKNVTSLTKACNELNEHCEEYIKVYQKIEEAF